MQAEAEEQIGPALLPGERVVWMGRAARGRLFSRWDLLLTLFFLVWGWGFFGVAGGLSLIVFGHDLFASLLLVWCAYGLVGRFVSKAWLQRRTVYAVTDQRVLVITNAFGQRVRVGFLNVLPHVSISTGRDGVGTLVFGEGSGLQTWYDRFGLAMLRWPRSNALAFYNIPNAAAVARSISEYQRKASPRERPTQVVHNSKRPVNLYEHADKRSAVLTTITGQIQTGPADVVLGADDWYYSVTTNEGRRGYVRTRDFD